MNDLDEFLHDPKMSQDISKICPHCGYFLIDIISWDQPLEICQRCYYEKEIGKKLYSKTN